MWPTKLSMGTVIVLVFLIALAAPIAVGVLNQSTISNPTVNEMAHAGEIKIQQRPESVVAAFDAALNAHDVNAGLDLFADNAFAHDQSRETYSSLIFSGLNLGSNPEVAPTCRWLGNSPICLYDGPTRIRDWLRQLAVENIQIEELGNYQMSGNNVTWKLDVSIDGYRGLGVAPLETIGEATVQGGKIQSLTLVLTTESYSKLSAAVVKSRQGRTSVATSGFLLGIISLGLILPATAIYYISKVKSLFAAVPRLEKPWLLLLGGVGFLFLAMLLILLKGFVSIPGWDAIYSVVLVLTAFFILASMVMMKRVWTITGSE